MVVPILNSGIEQPDFLFGFGVDTALEIQLEACQTQQVIVVSMEIDHIVPESAGGETTLANLCLACVGWAIFAATTRPIRDLLAQTLRNICHYAPSLSCFSTLCPRCFSSSSASERSSI